MKKPFGLIVGAAAGALLIAAVGASAHTGLFHLAGVSQGISGDEASGARESPEPSEAPEPAEAPEPSPTAEPSEAPEQDEQGDNDEQGEDTNDNETGPKAAPTGSGEHDDGGGGGGGSEHGD